MIAAVPTGAAQTMIAERVARNMAAETAREVACCIRHALGHVVTIAAMVGVIYALAIPLVVSSPRPSRARAPRSLCSRCWW